jgi:murein L,D-transpeptidase YafK
VRRPTDPRRRGARARLVAALTALLLAGPLLAGAARTGGEPARPLADLLRAAGAGKAGVRLVVEKARRRLHVVAKGKVLKSYPVVLGPAPKGDKMVRGDGRTPEGTFRVRSKYPHRSWSKFIWLDYPNAETWRRYRERLAAGKIAKERRGRDPGPGGEIGIHGTYSDAVNALRVDWTLGCVSLFNADVEEIYPFLGKGTEVEIRP